MGLTELFHLSSWVMLAFPKSRLLLNKAQAQEMSRLMVIWRDNDGQKNQDQLPPFLTPILYVPEFAASTRGIFIINAGKQVTWNGPDDLENPKN